MTTTLNTALPVVQRLNHTTFDRFFNDFVNRSWNTDRGEGVGMHQPAVDAYETSEGFHFLVDLPGMTREDLELTFENGMLTVSGERRPDWEPEIKGLHRRERAHGRFVRSFTLPQGMDLERIQAKFDNGVLRILVPKSELLRAKKVTIE